METLFLILILFFSVILHEIAHGYAALGLGDPTAKYAGRLTLNPISHIDPVGSVFVPILCAILPGSFMIGWAKPVPFNPYNLSNRRWGELMIAIAGPLTNFAIAIFFGLLIRFSTLVGLGDTFIQLSFTIVTVNVVLAIFNLVPIPPLDGSKILFGLFPSLEKHRDFFEGYGMFFVLLFVFFLSSYLTPLFVWTIEIITGLNIF